MRNLDIIMKNLGPNFELDDSDLVKKLTIKNSEGTGIAYAEFYISLATKSLQINTINVLESKKGNGIGKVLLSNLRDYALEENLEGITVETWKDGAHAWARMGLYPTKDSWEGLKPYMLATLEHERKNLGDTYFFLKQVLTQSTEPKNIWLISDLKDWGHNLLSRHSWAGGLPFSDGIAMKRFDAYTKVEEKQMAIIQEIISPSLSKHASIS